MYIEDCVIYKYNIALIFLHFPTYTPEAAQTL